MSKKRRKQKKGERQWRRSGHFVRHHVVNKARGGSDAPFNRIRMDSEREKAWHFLFHNLSYESVARLLMRVSRIKGESYGARS
jgi:hypothetical protein